MAVHLISRFHSDKGVARMWRDIGDDEALLRALGVEPANIVAREPMTGSLSGARLERLLLREEAKGTEGTGGAARYSSRVVKRLEAASGWLGALSRDTRLRELRLWSRSLLADLPAGIETGVLAWSELGGGECGGSSRPARGALLLRDVGGHLVRNPLRTPPGRLPVFVARLLDALARLHARYWCDARLRDPDLGLAPPEAALLLAAPESLARRVAIGDADPYLPLALAGWDAFFRLAAPADAQILRGVFANPALVLDALAGLPWTLLHGDIWGPNLGALPPSRRDPPRHGAQVLLLDWALAAAGPATYDPLWLCGNWHRLAPVRVLAAYRVRLARHLAARGIALAPETWQVLADAGYLRTALTCGEALGRAATEAPPGAPRRRAEARVRWWAARGARAAQRLSILPIAPR